MRLATGGPIGLDFGAALALGQALDADMGLLADVLPAVETAVLARWRGNSDTETFDDQEG